MALVKQKKSVSSSTEKRDETRDFDGLIHEMKSGNSVAKRWAVRDLADYPEKAVAPILNLIDQETDLIVRDAMLDTLEKIGGDKVVEGLIPYLRSEDVPLRNAVIDALQSSPDAIAKHILALLNDQDSDVRIFAIDILQMLPHVDTPIWLLSVLKDETHINVVANAVDRLSEVGTPDMVSELLALKIRFPDEAYLHFAIDNAIKRIKGE
ncbi:MAG: HEAT repeat domain-containing protein [Enterobacterales bacterium]|nr:HEAT repeat domain-containing protein [Enterobacterales bacterium]